MGLFTEIRINETTYSTQPYTFETVLCNTRKPHPILVTLAIWLTVDWMRPRREEFSHEGFLTVLWLCDPLWCSTSHRSPQRPKSTYVHTHMLHTTLWSTHSNSLPKSNFVFEGFFFFFFDIIDIESIVSASAKLYVPIVYTATARLPWVRKEGRRDRSSQKSRSVLHLQGDCKSAP